LITHTDHQHFQLGLGCLANWRSRRPSWRADRLMIWSLTPITGTSSSAWACLANWRTAPAELARRSFDDLITDTDHWHFQLGLGQSPATRPRTEAWLPSPVALGSSAEEQHAQK
jgi:hypothetical protein